MCPKNMNVTNKQSVNIPQREKDAYGYEVLLMKGNGKN